MATIIIDKVLTKNDINLRLAFPTGSLWAIPIPEGERAVNFQATDANQQQWNLRLSTQGDNHRYPKPVVTGEWLELVHAKGLVAGDKIILKMEVDEANGVQYTINARRSIFGFWVNVD